MVYVGASDAVVRETETDATTKVRGYAFDQLGDRATLSETVSGTTSRYSYVYDPLGSAEPLIDRANTIKAAYGYTAYGDPNPQLTKTAAGFTPSTNLYRYTGKRWDPAAKAYDMGARHYFPSQGRWFQRDEVPPFLRTSERLVRVALGDEGGALCHGGFSGRIRRSFGVRRSAWSRPAAARYVRSPASLASATSRCGSGCGRISSIAVSVRTG